MPDNNIVATLQEGNEVIATIEKYPYQGIQGVIDKMYLWNPDVANELIEELNKILDVVITDVVGEGNIVCSHDGNTVTVKDTTFVFEQGVASDTWVIEHNLDKHPSITVVDSAENVVTGSYTYIDENTVELHFNAPFKGTAYLN